jgi:peroxiredoxin (alkyl hydroperoxide reductase subunit C)
MSVLVSKQAPDFTAAAVLADGSIKADFKLADYKGSTLSCFSIPSTLPLSVRRN